MKAKPLVAEYLGTAGLLMSVAGSGIMGQELAGGNIAIALLANAIATGAALFVLITMFGDISGAHFNPIVTLTAAVNREMAVKDAVLYVLTQMTGAISGVILANAMFDLSMISISAKARGGAGQMLGEFIASFGLIGVITLVSRRFNTVITAVSVASFITSAYWFTSSTSFANPAVTAARMFTDTFTGIRPADALPFIAVQIVGAVAAAYIFNWLLPREIK